VKPPKHTYVAEQRAAPDAGGGAARAGELFYGMPSMSQGAALAKAALAAFLAVGGLWHLFGSALSKWLADDGRSRQMRRRRAQAQDDPSQNVPIDPR
jgi:hypothetical protein